MSKIEEKVMEAVSPVITSLGYDIYDLEYAKEGKDYYLRIFIDKEEGISIDDCELVNNSITDLLDEKNYIKDQYYLEVSSSGLERRLRKEWHFEKYKGSKVEASLFKAINKQKKIIGILKEFNEKAITIETETNETLELERTNISIIKTVYDF